MYRPNVYQMEGNKFCYDCMQWLKGSSFNKKSALCKSCKGARQRKLQEERKLRVKPVLKAHRCSRCRLTKSVNDFHKSVITTTGYAGYCKPCTRINQITVKYNVKWDEAVIFMRTTHCEICRKEFLSNSKKHIDHCHVSGKVRGVLCDTCNLGIGCFQDNVESLQNAIEYLKGRE